MASSVSMDEVMNSLQSPTKRHDDSNRNMMGSMTPSSTMGLSFSRVAQQQSAKPGLFQSASDFPSLSRKKLPPISSMSHNNKFTLKNSAANNNSRRSQDTVGKESFDNDERIESIDYLESPSIKKKDN